MKQKIVSVFVILASVAFTTQLSAYDYEFSIIEPGDIDQVLRIGSDATGTPPALQGLWWMDGNPLPDEVVSFAGAEFSEIVQNGEVVGHHVVINTTDEGVWSWHHSLPGYMLYFNLRMSRAQHIMDFNLDYSYADLTLGSARGFNLGDIVGGEGGDSSATLVKVNENEYRRDTVFFGGDVRSYRLRRIVDGDGNRLPAYQDYVDDLHARGVDKLFLPFCTIGDGQQLPTPCFD